MRLAPHFCMHFARALPARLHGIDATRTDGRAGQPGDALQVTRGELQRSFRGNRSL